MKSVVGTILSLLALVVFYLELAGKKVPFIPEGYKAGFWAVAIIGFSACIIGGIGASAVGGKIDWANPFVIVGGVLGALVLFLAILVLTGKQFWFIQSDKSALIAIGIIVIVKLLATLIHRFVK